jgi:hypothetical protein
MLRNQSLGDCRILRKERRFRGLRLMTLLTRFEGHEVEEQPVPCASLSTTCISGSPVAHNLARAVLPVPMESTWTLILELSSTMRVNSRGDCRTRFPDR